MNLDPRLEAYTFNADFAFPQHATPSPFDPNLNHYALPLNSTLAQPDSPQRNATNNGQRGSPQTRLRTGQASSLNQRMSSASASSPNRRQNTNQSQTRSPRNVVFKNPSNIYSQGPMTGPIDHNMCALAANRPQPPSSLHQDTNPDYFSAQPSQPNPTLDDSLLTPPPASSIPNPKSAVLDAVNPFSDTFPLIADPPDLDAWRFKLFNISLPLHLTESQFLTYFPHIDNVYSHRSTQKYKRKPFVSHYWDCRLKGRPSGTKKSNDPNVKRRKREKRELGLCDVKIKITEWFGRDEAEKMGLQAVCLGEGEAQFDYIPGFPNSAIGGRGTQGGLQVVLDGRSSAENGITDRLHDHEAGMGVVGESRKWPAGHPGADSRKWYTIQRVDPAASGPHGGRKPTRDSVGEGGGYASSDEDEDMGDPERGGTGERNLDHKHPLEESDRIKKNSVQRSMLKEEKERRASKKTKLDTPLLRSPQSQPQPTPSAVSSIRPSRQLSSTTSSSSLSSTYLASGPASSTIRLHRPAAPTKLTFFANAFCPFAQRVWIALEIKGVAYQMVEITPEMIQALAAGRAAGVGVDIGVPYVGGGGSGGGSGGGKGAGKGKNITGPPKELLSVNPDAQIPCIKHGNWGIWESNVMMEYLEDFTMEDSSNSNGAAGTDTYVALLPVNPQLKAHCRLWVDHVNRKVLPAFYALLLTPPPRRPSGTAPSAQSGAATASSSHPPNTGVVNEPNPQEDPLTTRHSMLIVTLQTAITALVNASHATGPFFLGDSISYVDVAFAPWIIRLSRVLSYYRNFPRPEVGTRWRAWVDAVEGDERVRRTVSEERSYHGVYRGVGEDGVGIVRGGDGAGADMGGQGKKKVMVEIEYARKIMSEEGFGLGGDLYGLMGIDPAKEGRGLV